MRKKRPHDGRGAGKDPVGRDEKRMRGDEKGTDRRIKKDNWSKGG